MSAVPGAARRLAELRECLAGLDLAELDAWGRDLATALLGGHRLLAAGNGGSAAEAQHLTAELVGRYRHDRPPLAAVALHADTSTVTAVGNDYGYAEVFARQVEAHGRAGDVLVLLTTSGRSENCVAAARRARERGVAVWALTGPAPHPLQPLCDRLLAVPAASAATIQEVHLVAVHLLCAAVDEVLGADPYRGYLDAPLGALDGALDTPLDMPVDISLGTAPPALVLPTPAQGAAAGVPAAARGRR